MLVFPDVRNEEKRKRIEKKNQRPLGWGGFFGRVTGALAAGLVIRSEFGCIGMEKKISDMQALRLEILQGLRNYYLQPALHTTFFY